ncbi:MAG: hypothetical protein IJS08_02625, partial [Victivallales bacterium]|nr:hypothetical protein [Victivallales bacterium]
MMHQFTYTASPWGKTGIGWMVFQQSPGVTSDVTKKLYEIYRYEETRGATGKAAFPVQFAYLPMEKGGGAVLAQTTFIGKRWWGEPRPGDFYAHVFLLDENAVLESAKAGINPVRLFLSPDIQSAFPEGLKKKALDIYNKVIGWEAPPELGDLRKLGDIKDNPQLAFGAALEAIPERAVPQLGPLVCAIMMRTTGKLEHPIVFDSGNEYSPLVMSLALDLIPPTWRART